jgi:site-specific DNA-methyltransferase (adenine-specific)
LVALSTSPAGSLIAKKQDFSVSYNSGTAELIQGDAFKLLREWPDQTVDMIFADPPYRLSNGGFSCQNGRRASVNKGSWDKARSLAEDHAYNVEWLQECQRILKPTGTIWVSGTQHVIFSIGFALQSLGYHLLNTVAWLKPNASPNLSCRYFTHSTELIVWASPTKSKPLQHTFNYKLMKEENGGKQMRDVWEIPVPPRSEKLLGKHPTQKPLRLMRRLVAASTNTGDIVLDPFAGSCSTGVACMELGRQFVGCEREPEFIELGSKRLAMAAKTGPASVETGPRSTTRRRAPQGVTVRPKKRAANG